MRIAYDSFMGYGKKSKNIELRSTNIFADRISSPYTAILAHKISQVCQFAVKDESHLDV